MKKSRRIIGIVCLVLIFTGCNLTEWYNDFMGKYDDFPGFHIGTRWICQELEMFFDVISFENVDGEMSTGVGKTLGKLVLDEEDYCVQAVFLHKHFIEIFMCDANYCNLPNMTPNDDEWLLYRKVTYICENGVMVVTIDKSSYVHPMLNFTGNTLTFVCQDIPEGEQITPKPRQGMQS